MFGSEPLQLQSQRQPFLNARKDDGVLPFPRSGARGTSGFIASVLRSFAMPIPQMPKHAKAPVARVLIPWLEPLRRPPSAEARRNNPWPRTLWSSLCLF